VLYDSVAEAEIGNTDDVGVHFRVAIGPFCRIMELIDLVCAPRLRKLRQRLIEARREAFEASEWDKHAYIIQVLSYQDL